MLNVFDIDGVLADTHDAVIAAYKLVGVDMPAWAWGQPWQEWLPDVAGTSLDDAAKTHREKTRRYVAMLSSGQLREMPAAQIVRDLVVAEKHVLLVTSASVRAATTLVRSLSISPDLIAGTSLELTRRLSLVSRLSGGSHVTYFDDDLRNCLAAEGVPNWTVMNIMDTTTEDDIRRAIQWTQ